MSAAAAEYVAPSIDAESLHEQKAEFRVIDVRAPEEWVGELGHIESATNIPLECLDDRCEGWPRDQRLVLVCRVGRRSAMACKRLAARGFTDVRNLEGGMMAWKFAGLPASREP